jgi:hypothetical protein
MSSRKGLDSASTSTEGKKKGLRRGREGDDAASDGEDTGDTCWSRRGGCATARQTVSSGLCKTCCIPKMHKNTVLYRLQQLVQTLLQNEAAPPCRAPWGHRIPTALAGSTLSLLFGSSARPPSPRLHRLPALPLPAVSSTLPHPRRPCRSTREEAAPPQEQRRRRSSSRSGGGASRWRESSTADVAELLLPQAPRSWRPSLLLVTRAGREIWPRRRCRCRPSSTASMAEQGEGEASEHGRREAASAPATVCSPPPPSPSRRSSQACCSASLLPKPAATSRSTAGGARGGSRAGDSLPKPGLAICAPPRAWAGDAPSFSLMASSSFLGLRPHAGVNCREAMRKGSALPLEAVLLCATGASAYDSFLQMRYGNLLETVSRTGTQRFF